MAVFVFGTGVASVSGGGSEVIVPPPLDPVFANNDWETIALVCQANAVPDTWAVGNSKTMTINGADYLIDIIGKNHDVYSDGTGVAPLTFQLHDAYLDEYAMHNINVNNWELCDMRNVRLPSVMSSMPINVQTSIREINKPTLYGSPVVTKITSEKLFFLSEFEVHGGVTYARGVEGNQYEYYMSGGKKNKTKDGKSDLWWTRSPRANSENQFCIVSSTGNPHVESANRPTPMSFAFCF